MDFDYGEAAEKFRIEFRHWLEDNLDPDWRAHVGDVNLDNPAAGADHPWLREWDRRLYEAGYKGIAWPAEYGGRGLSLLEQVVFHEELVAADAPVVANFLADTLLGPTIIKWGTDAQKERFLGPILRGEEFWCQGFSEPDAGSDLASLATRAVLDGDEWVVSGQKVWTTNAHFADFCFCLARTDPQASPHKGISFLLVPMKQPGVTVRPLRQPTGTDEFNEVFFDEARAPVGNVVGGLNNGWAVAMTTLGFERGSSVTTQFLTYRRELDEIVDVARSRGLLRDPRVRSDIAAAHAKVAIMKANAYRTLTALTAAGADLQDVTGGFHPSLNKMFWSEYHQWVTDLGMNLRGPAELVVGDGYQVTSQQFAFLFARSETIWGGTSQVQRNIVGERLLGLPKEPKPGENTQR